MKFGKYSPEDKQLETECKQSRNIFYHLIHIDVSLVKYHRWIGATVLFLGLGGMGLDYLVHPEARRFQSQVVQDLRTLPVPSGTTELDFSSGYQPSKGMAERTIALGIPVKDICSFYRPIMEDSGWQIVKEECYPSSEGHALIVFRKGKVTCKIDVGHQDISVTKYVIVSTWPR
jgi:hypothetical protein